MSVMNTFLQAVSFALIVWGIQPRLAFKSGNRRKDKVRKSSEDERMSQTFFFFFSFISSTTSIITGNFHVCLKVESKKYILL